MLNELEEFIRESPMVQVQRRFSANGVVEVLTDLILSRAIPASIQSDTGLSPLPRPSRNGSPRSGPESFRRAGLAPGTAMSRDSMRRCATSSSMVRSSTRRENRRCLSRLDDVTSMQSGHMVAWASDHGRRNRPFRQLGSPAPLLGLPAVLDHWTVNSLTCRPDQSVGPVSVPTGFLGPAIVQVRYKISLVAYLDILGFRNLIATKEAREVSGILRAVNEAVEPPAHKMRLKTHADGITEDEYVHFSDLSLIVRPFEGGEAHRPASQLFALLLHIVQAQARLVIDEGILIRGAVTVGKAVKSSGQVFGPAVVRAYELERKVAKYPRIIIDERVFEALRSSPEPWFTDEHTDMHYLQLLTRTDTDQTRFVDYLRAVRDELDDPAYYSVCLDRHDEVIRNGLQRCRWNLRIRPKYRWLKRYHESTIDRMN